MFGKLISKLKNSVDETEQIDERFYAEVMDELAQGYKDKALVGKAIAQSNGNEAKFDSIYVKLRAKTLQEKDIQNMKLEQTKLFQDEKEEDRKTIIKEKLEEGSFAKQFYKQIEAKGYIKSYYWGKNTFKKNGEIYTGKIDYKLMRYVLANENNEYTDYVSFEIK